MAYKGFYKNDNSNGKILIAEKIQYSFFTILIKLAKERRKRKKERIWVMQKIGKKYSNSVIEAVCCRNTLRWKMK